MREVLIIIGCFVVAGFLVTWLLPFIAGAAAVAFLAWVVSALTGIPFWGAVVLIIVLGIVGYAVFMTSRE